MAKNNNDNSLVVYKSMGEEIRLNNLIVRSTIAKGEGITDTEIYNFIQLCKYRKLNPFLGEAYLVKFGGVCSQIVGLSVFQQRLNNNPKNEGFELGIITIDDKNIIHEREGTFFPSEIEKLIGAYVVLHKKGVKPLKWTVNLKAYQKEIFDKKINMKRPQGQWQSMPEVMITKCCFVAGVRYYYPEEFGGMYSAEEIGMDENEIIEITQTVTDEQIEQLKQEAKSSKYNDETADKLIEYILNKLVEKNTLRNSNIEDIPEKSFEEILKLIKTFKYKKIMEIEKEESRKISEIKLKERKSEESKSEEIEKEELQDPEAYKDKLIKKEIENEKQQKSKTKKEEVKKDEPKQNK